MKKRVLNCLGSIVLAVLMLSCVVVDAFAQLPANPWNNQPSQSSSNNQNILPTDPWSRSRPDEDYVSWRTSGNHGEGLDYKGHATTFGTAMGQEMIAPEVNLHNMEVMLNHLRSLGYQIPADYNQKIRNMPESVRTKILNALDDTYHPGDNNPFSRSVAGTLDWAEGETGLSVNNLLMNSIDLLKRDQ